MATFVSLQRTEPEYCNFTFSLDAADKSCSMLWGSTVIFVNDNHTPASYIRSIFGRFAYCYMLENWRSARLAQSVRSLTANQKVPGSKFNQRGLKYERPSFATPPVDGDVKPLV